MRLDRKFGDYALSQGATRRGAILGLADSLSNASLIVAPIAGGVVLDADPRAIGLLPAVSIAGAFALGVAARERRGAAKPG